MIAQDPNPLNKVSTQTSTAINEEEKKALVYSTKSTDRRKRESRIRKSPFGHLPHDPMNH